MKKTRKREGTTDGRKVRESGGAEDQQGGSEGSYEEYEEWKNPGIDGVVRVWTESDGAVDFYQIVLTQVWSERMSEELTCFQEQGDVLSCGNYRGIKLISHTMKM